MMKKIIHLVVMILAFGQMVNATGWIQRADLPAPPRCMGVGFGIGGKGYVGTGWDTSAAPNYRLQSDFWEYDTLTNAWTQKVDFAGTPRYGAVGFAIGTKGYIGTGYDFGTYNTDFWEYDPAGNAWISRAAFPGTGRYQAVGFGMSNKGYIGTGGDISDVFSDFWEYNQTTDTWLQLADVGGGGRALASGISINGKGYVGLGVTATGDAIDFWEYTPSTNTWLQRADFGGIARDGAAAFNIGGFGYIGTGSSSAFGNVLHDFWRFDPTSNTWATEVDFPGQDRDGAVGFSIGPSGYIGTGSPGNNPHFAFPNVYKFTPTCTNPIITGASANIATICSNASANLSATGILNSALNWYWYTGSCGGNLVSTGTTVTVNPTTSTWYYVRGEGGCAIATNCDSVLINVNNAPTPVVSHNGPTDFCLGGSVILNAGIFTAYNWSTTSTTATTTASASGTYTVTVTDAIGCTGTSSQIVTVYNLPTPIITGGSSVCFQGSLTLDAGNFVSYHWSNSSTTETITFNTANTYIVTVTDSHGCTGTTSQVVTLNTLVTPVITGGSSFCSGGSLTISTGAFSSYNWSNGETTQSTTVTSANTYTVTVSDINGCTGTTSQTVTINPNPTPTVTANGSTTFCAGGSVVLNAGIYSSYNWSTNATAQTITASTMNTFSVTVTDGNGCTGSASQATIVNQNPTPAITTNGATIFCQGGSVTLTTGAFANYNWSNSSTTQAILATVSGTFVVTVTDANGCTGTATQDVTANPLPTATITGGTSLCSGGTLVLDGGSHTLYHWSTGSLNETITVVITGTYTLTVTDINGCTATTSQNVVVGTSPVPVITGGTVFCQGGSLTIGVASFTSYSWSNAATTQTITVNSASTYTVTVSNASGCTGTASQVITMSTNPTPTITGNTTFCAGGSTTLDGGSFTQYNWSNGANTELTNIFTANIYYLTVTNINGCTGTTSAIVTTIPGPVPAITPNGPTSFCGGGSVALNAGAFASYHWSNFQTTQSVVATTSGTYTVTVYNTAGCTGTTSIVVTVIANPTPTISPAGNISLCDGESVMLLCSNGVLYTWSNGETTQGITVAQTGNYSVTVAYGANCSSASTVTHVVVHPIPVATITSHPSDPVICNSDSLQLTTVSATSPLTYSWTGGATTQSIYVNTAGSFVVLVTDTNNCHSTSSITVTSYLNPVASFTSANFITTTTFTNTSVNATSYYWYFGDGSVSNQANPTHIYAQTGTYTVKLIATNPCGTDTIIHTLILTGIDEVNPAMIGFNSYPNPANDMVNIIINSTKEEPSLIQLTDVTGRIIQSINHESVIGENQFQMNLSGVSKGVYMMTLKMGNANLSTKLLVQ